MRNWNARYAFNWMHVIQYQVDITLDHFLALWLFLALWFGPSGQNFWPLGFIYSAVQIQPYGPTSELTLLVIDLVLLHVKVNESLSSHSLVKIKNMGHWKNDTTNSKKNWQFLILFSESWVVAWLNNPEWLIWVTSFWRWTTSQSILQKIFRLW